jgi:rRNA-processing protein FCF1
MTIEERLYERHRGNRVLLDSNLLLLFLVGGYSLSLIRTFKRVSDYSVQDYRLLVEFLGSFKILVVTPHVLTEVSNLANSLPQGIKTEWFRSFAELLASQGSTPGLREHHIAADAIAKTREFYAFGITDAAISLISSDTLVVTADYRLSGTLRKKGVEVLNFSDLRLLQKKVLSI